MVAVADALVTYLSSSYLAHTVTEVVQEEATENYDEQAQQQRQQMLPMPMLDLPFPLKHLVVVGAGEDDRSAVPHHHCLDPSFSVLTETTQHLAYYYYYYYYY